MESSGNTVLPASLDTLAGRTSASLRVGIVTVSDRASAGVYDDLSGAAIRRVLGEWIASPWSELYRCVPDDRPTVEAVLVELIDWHGCSLVITTGGTGPAPRDITPDATEAVCDRLLPGFGEAMRTESLRTVPTAILSRQVAGTRNASLVINLPGKPASIEVCLAAVWAGVLPCLKLLGAGRFSSTAAAPGKAAAPAAPAALAAPAAPGAPVASVAPAERPEPTPPTHSAP